jgi:hypothetical protein
MKVVCKHNQPTNIKEAPPTTTTSQPGPPTRMPHHDEYSPFLDAGAPPCHPQLATCASPHRWDSTPASTHQTNNHPTHKGQARSTHSNTPDVAVVSRNVRQGHPPTSRHLRPQAPGCCCAWHMPICSLTCADSRRNIHLSSCHWLYSRACTILVSHQQPRKASTSTQCMMQSPFLPSVSSWTHSPAGNRRTTIPSRCYI